ncbi:hypothetical protein [Acidithiobacillus sp. IBUN Pt1247-S3]|uniref:hypothetical protein n=1 Tax=Acidithiobacillus sp. IBUN Pt1247-S3 TaxID=3166642 RepID=UPI0034E414CF
MSTTSQLRAGILAHRPGLGAGIMGGIATGMMAGTGIGITENLQEAKEDIERERCLTAYQAQSEG